MHSMPYMARILSDFMATSWPVEGDGNSKDRRETIIGYSIVLWSSLISSCNVWLSAVIAVQAQYVVSLNNRSYMHMTELN